MPAPTRPTPHRVEPKAINPTAGIVGVYTDLEVDALLTDLQYPIPVVSNPAEIAALNLGPDQLAFAGPMPPNNAYVLIYGDPAASNGFEILEPSKLRNRINQLTERALPRYDDQAAADQAVVDGTAAAGSAMLIGPTNGPFTLAVSNGTTAVALGGAGDLSNYVDRTTNQSVSGRKTFTAVSGSKTTSTVLGGTNFGVESNTYSPELDTVAQFFVGSLKLTRRDKTTNRDEVVNLSGSELRLLTGNSDNTDQKEFIAAPGDLVVSRDGTEADGHIATYDATAGKVLLKPAAAAGLPPGGEPGEFLYHDGTWQDPTEPLPGLDWVVYTGDEAGVEKLTNSGAWDNFPLGAASTANGSADYADAFTINTEGRIVNDTQPRRVQVQAAVLVSTPADLNASLAVKVNDRIALMGSQSLLRNGRPGPLVMNGDILIPAGATWQVLVAIEPHGEWRNWAYTRASRLSLRTMELLDADPAEDEIGFYPVQLGAGPFAMVGNQDAPWARAPLHLALTLPERDLTTSKVRWDQLGTGTWTQTGGSAPVYASSFSNEGQTGAQIELGRLLETWHSVVRIQLDMYTEPGQTITEAEFSWWSNGGWGDGGTPRVTLTQDPADPTHYTGTVPYAYATAGGSRAEIWIRGTGGKVNGTLTIGEFTPIGTVAWDATTTEANQLLPITVGGDMRQIDATTGRVPVGGSYYITGRVRSDNFNQYVSLPFGVATLGGSGGWSNIDGLRDFDASNFGVRGGPADRYQGEMRLLRVGAR